MSCGDGQVRASELDPPLKCNHARRAVDAQSDSHQTSRGRDGAGDGAEACLGRGFRLYSSLIDGQRKVGMVENIEELRVEAERDQSIAMSKPPLIPVDC